MVHGPWQWHGEARLRFLLRTVREHGSLAAQPVLQCQWALSELLPQPLPLRTGGAAFKLPGRGTAIPAVQWPSPWRRWRGIAWAWHCHQLPLVLLALPLLAAPALATLVAVTRARCC